MNSNGLSASRVVGNNASHSSRTGNLVFMTASGSSPTEKMRINSAGSMGLGTGANIDERVHFENAGNITMLLECSTSGGGSNAALRLKSADSSSDWYVQTGNATSGALRFYGGAERMKIDTSGHVTINDGDLVVGTSGHGISFAATSDAGGMDNELLDDYEEGSWTPTARNDGSFTNSLGRYVKIGQQVTVWGFIPTVTNITSNNTLQVSGLPYTVASGGSTEYVGTLMIRFVASTSLTGVSFNCYTYSGRDYIEFYACRDDDNNYEAIQHSDLAYTNSNGIRFSLTYVV